MAVDGAARIRQPGAARRRRMARESAFVAQQLAARLAVAAVPDRAEPDDPVDARRRGGLVQRLGAATDPGRQRDRRSEEHTSELQSLMRISYAVFCLKKKKTR